MTVWVPGRKKSDVMWKRTRKLESISVGYIRPAYWLYPVVSDWGGGLCPRPLSTHSPPVHNSQSTASAQVYAGTHSPFPGAQMWKHYLSHTSYSDGK